MTPAQMEHVTFGSAPPTKREVLYPGINYICRGTDATDPTPYRYSTDTVCDGFERYQGGRIKRASRRVKRSGAARMFGKSQT